jgi:hypothetical protein
MRLFIHAWPDATVTLVLADNVADAAERLGVLGDVDEEAIHPVDEFFMTVGRDEDEDGDAIWVASFDEETEHAIDSAVLEEDDDDEEEEEDDEEVET